MPDHLHPTDIDQYLFCRVCFCGPDLVLNEGGQLISPCSCSGSVRHVHLHCLRTWQATQRAQGRSQKSHSCELCGSKYVISEELLQRERRQSSCVERVYSGLKRAWQWCNDTAQGPVWQEALRYWRNALLVAGLYKATLWGIVGVVAGGRLGLNSASKGAHCLARMAPSFMVTALLFPKMQVPLMVGSALALTGLAAGATALTMAGAYCGAFYGFCSGTLGFLKWALITHLDTAAVGYKCTELTIGAVLEIALNLSGRFASFLRRNIL